MKKATSLLLSGLLVSGMVLGTVSAPVTTVNAEGTASTTAENEATNLIKFTDVNGNAIKDLPATSVKASVGAKINMPDGYSLYPGLDQEAVVKADGTTQTFKVVKTDQITNVTINYVDEATKTQVGETSVDAVIGQTLSIPKPDITGYVLSDADASVEIAKDATYSINVTKEISNTIIFKTADNEQVGTATISGKKVGETVDVTSQLPKGYAAKDATVALQANGNTQIVTVNKADNGVTPFKSVVTTNTDSEYTPLYTKTGTLANRALRGGTDWQTNNKMTLDGVVYYQVSTTEWVKASDVSVKSTDNNTNTEADAVGAEKSDVNKVTTKNVNITPLYTRDGQTISNRGLGKNSAWATDLMKTINGAKMYRVATNEWVKASDIK